uniref:T-lymphocyte surface antigen Ly-9 n=1 Tax=Gasterosteus aculeatus aculeatus TaxID=481459 RepID=UPI001A987AA7|nr:T-lymphocyte surface antigen Ly-9 [Gasterosteus aculeatus aculeatus]
MKLQTYLILFLQVVLVKCLPDISGFLGGNVTLPSGVDPSWELSSIVWTIFLNSTWIATYRNKWKNLDHLARYKGRLGLNSSTGDLTIHHLTLEDALQYTVALTGTPGQKSLNKVTVRVTKPLQKPTIEVFESKSNKCHWSVRCESTDEGVLLSLEATPPAVTSGCNLTDTNGHSVALLYIRGSTQHPVEVTCTSHRGEEKASSSVKATCSGNELEPPLPPTIQPTTRHRTRYLLAFLLGLMTGILLLVGALCLSNHYRGNKNECI